MCSGLFVVVFLLFACSHAKECTDNYHKTFATKTLRSKVSISMKASWTPHDHTDHDHADHHLTPTWSSMSPDSVLREEDQVSWNSMYRNIKFSANMNGTFLEEISLHDVRLDPDSLHGQAQHTNLVYLLMLDVESLVWNFRKVAGLPTLGHPYGGWEAPDFQLRGHFVGHYLSATAHMWASTHNTTLKRKSTALVAALKECQDAMGTGYLSAFPSEFFDRLETLNEVWAPYYTIHKIMAGLLDQYKLVGSSEALRMVTWMASYFYRRVQNVVTKYTIEQHWLMLNEETGGMNDVLYQLFRITGDQKHLLLAHLFDKPCFLGILAMKADHISEFHANTHIPIVIGAQLRYEVTGDELYKEISSYFLDIVNSTHSFATGGTSVFEHWKDPKRLGDKLHSENEESCTTYNMLKVSRNLFRWTKEVTYADYYERALTNGVLSIQRGSEPGVMIYMLPLGHGVSKGISNHGWGNPFNSFWCCYGTGIESFSKLGDSIYFEEEGKVPQLYVIQYISSSLDWNSARIQLTQAADNVASLNRSLKVKFKISADESSGMATLNLRIPSWTSSSGLKAYMNGDALPVPNPVNFLSITRNWGNADEVALQFPLLLRTESVQDDRPNFASLEAILYGPFLLAGLSLGDYDIKIGSGLSVSDWITPILADYNSHLISITQESEGKKFCLINQKEVIIMQTFVEAQNDTYVHATFRLIFYSGIQGEEGIIGRTVMLEPFDLPGMVLAYHDTHLNVVYRGNGHLDKFAEFLIVKGLSGLEGTISLQNQEGCFVYSSIKQSSSDREVRLNCRVGSSSDLISKEAVSFIYNHGFKKYHPISFVAKGLRRSYVLEPLLGLKNESYNVYFNITES